MIERTLRLGCHAVLPGARAYLSQRSLKIGKLCCCQTTRTAMITLDQPALLQQAIEPDALRPEQRRLSARFLPSAPLFGHHGACNDTVATRVHHSSHR